MAGTNKPEVSDHKAENEDSGAAAGLALNYWQLLVEYTDNDGGEPALCEFSKLQTLNITHLLNELAHIKGDVKQNKTTSAEQMNHLRQTLHQYADAIRDFQYIKELNLLPEIYAQNKRISLHAAFPKHAYPFPGTKNYPYHTTYRTFSKKVEQPKDAIREFLRKSLPNRLSWTDAEQCARRDHYSHGKAPEVYSSFLDSLAKFIIGTLGGCALIVPMMVMVLHPSLTKSLITVSVAVVLFALVSSLLLETNNKDTITATATYAAVLVVFVGSGGAAGGDGAAGSLGIAQNETEDWIANSPEDDTRSNRPTPATSRADLISQLAILDDWITGGDSPLMKDKFMLVVQSVVVTEQAHFRRMLRS